MSEIKYALLDTDFVSKANIIQADADHVLADKVLMFPNYVFVCHDFMIEELSRHGKRSAQEWLNSKIADGDIHKYSDEDILDMLSEVLGDKCYSRYLTYLKKSCDAFATGYFEEKYASLIALTEGETTKQQFLDELSRCESLIGPQQSLGEKKAFLLLMVLKFITGEDVFFFCSDDFGARKGLSDAAGIPCISIIAVFMKMKNMGISKEEADTYFQSFCAFCKQSGQTTLRVWEFNGSYRRVKVDLADVLNDLYAGKYALMLNGDLQIQ